MNILNNPILMCGLIAFGIILLLVVVVIICCKRSNYNEREELKMISDEIDADLNENVMEEEPDEETLLKDLSKRCHHRSTKYPSLPHNLH